MPQILKNFLENLTIEEAIVVGNYFAVFNVTNLCDIRDILIEKVNPKKGENV